MSISDTEQGVSSMDSFLSKSEIAQTIVEVATDSSFFNQGDIADSVFFLQKGRAKLSVVSEKGKQATIAILSPGDFFGEGSLAIGSKVHLATASAVYDCVAIKMKTDEMMRVMHEDHSFTDSFLSCLVARATRTQADLVDHILNSSEKRLARTLLLMADRGKPEESQTLIPPITQETLAEMIGTTRSRVSFFMNRFRSLGLIEYKDRIRVHKPLLRAVLLGQFADI
jgi:CRP/FNR family cyclic AMP-dependent transcriptional regulator